MSTKTDKTAALNALLAMSTPQGGAPADSLAPPMGAPPAPGADSDGDILARLSDLEARVSALEGTEGGESAPPPAA